MLLFRSRESRKFVITVECRRVESVLLALTSNRLFQENKACDLLQLDSVDH